MPNEFLHLVPNSLDRQIAALAEPLGCILNGATRASWKPNDPALILGGGPIGLLFLDYAELSGASPIVVSEPNPDRAAVALDMGADHIVDPRQPNAMTTLNALADGHGFPIVVDTLGTLLETALHAAAKGAEIWVFGVNHTATSTITPSFIVDKELRISGIYIAKGTFPLALKLLAAHPGLFGKIVSNRIPLTDWESAKALLMSGKSAGKILVTMDSD